MSANPRAIFELFNMTVYPYRSGVIKPDARAPLVATYERQTGFATRRLPNSFLSAGDLMFSDSGLEHGREGGRLASLGNYRDRFFGRTCRALNELCVRNRHRALSLLNEWRMAPVATPVGGHAVARAGGDEVPAVARRFVHFLRNMAFRAAREVTDVMYRRVIEINGAAIRPPIYATANRR
jgi:hypothetical protein